MKKQDDLQIFVPVPDCLQFQDNKIILRKAYEEFNIKRKKREQRTIQDANLKDGKSSGVMNRNIAQKMKKIVRNFVKVVSKSGSEDGIFADNIVTFVTLTLSSKQEHDDKVLNRQLLNEFIIKIKNKHGVKNYIWRAERQENGNLHYHIMIDKYIHYDKINTYWNVIQEGLQYINRYKKNQINRVKNEYKIELKNSQKIEHYCVKIDDFANWYESLNYPNSTDIHGLQKVESVENYICKYMTKEVNRELLKELKMLQESAQKDENSILDLQNIILKNVEKHKINARIWGCSDEIRNLKDYVHIIDNEAENLLYELQNDENVIVKTYENAIIFISKNVIKRVEKYKQITAKYNNFYSSIYLSLYKKEKYLELLKVKEKSQLLIKKVDKKLQQKAIQMRFFKLEKPDGMFTG